MKLNKLVCENLDEFVKSELNESVFDKAKDVIKKVKSFIKKVGKYYVAMYNDAIMNLVLPVNIGINFKNKTLGDNALEYYVPSKADLKLEPSLGKYTGDKCASDVVMKAKKQHQDFNKKYPTIGAFANSYRLSMSESVKSKNKKGLNEGTEAFEHYDKNIGNLNVAGLQRAIDIKMRNPTSRALLVWGAPAIGKTAIIKAVLDKRNQNQTFISFNAQVMTPEAWFMPFVDEAKEEGMGYTKGEAIYTELPKGNLPVYKLTDDPIKNKERNDRVNNGEGGILFFDELSRCETSVQDSVLSLMGERQIGDFKLGDKWVIIAAANRYTDEAGKHNISSSSTLSTRCRQVNFVPTYEEWKSYAKTVGVRPEILLFLDNNYEELLYTKNKSKDQQIYASPRTWEEASVVLNEYKEYFDEIGEKMTKVDTVQALTQAVGLDVALRVAAFMFITDKYDLTKIANVWTDPSKGPILFSDPKKEVEKTEAFKSTEITAIVVLALGMKEGKTLTPVEWSNFAKWLTSLNNASAAGYALTMLIDQHTYMHPDLGDHKKDAAGNYIGKYKKGMDILYKFYADLWLGVDMPE